MNNRAATLLRNVLPPAVFGVLFLALWEFVVKFFDLKPYFLAPPSKIWQKFTENFDLVWGATKVSGTNALIGLLAGLLAAAGASGIGWGPVRMMISP